MGETRKDANGIAPSTFISKHWLCSVQYSWGMIVKFVQKASLVMPDAAAIRKTKLKAATSLYCMCMFALARLLVSVIFDMLSVGRKNVSFRKEHTSEKEYTCGEEILFYTGGRWNFDLLRANSRHTVTIEQRGIRRSRNLSDGSFFRLFLLAKPS